MLLRLPYFFFLGFKSETEQPNATMMRMPKRTQTPLTPKNEEVRMRTVNETIREKKNAIQTSDKRIKSPGFVLVAGCSKFSAILHEAIGYAATSQ